MADRFVSRAGLKLEHALETFDVDVTDLLCADFGCNVGGFTDCLLQRGARAVHALDTGYGTLAWTLRNDPRVTVRERTNVMHAEPPEGGVDLVVVDLGWTPQRHALPAAAKWLRPDGRIVSLVKPHYELNETERRAKLVDGRLAPEIAERVAETVWAGLPELGFEVLGRCLSPIKGGKSGRGGGGRGNVEFLCLVRPL